MRDINEIVFIELFKEACHKCFGTPLTTALSETDSKLLSNKILEQTGLLLGVKSLKNYSLYILKSKESKENPSIATLDVLARYVLDAPRTDEIQRKNNEGHFPYWFQYKKSFKKDTNLIPSVSPRRKTGMLLILSVVIIAILAWLLYPFSGQPVSNFNEPFTFLSYDSLTENGWWLQNPDNEWWEKRREKKGSLSLYTLKGDNWPDAKNVSGIRNLLVRKILGDCFSTEIHLNDFVPDKNWQQAGILLSEDSTFSHKVVRISISYNDFFGGYSKPPEIIVQGVSSSESGSTSQPEEFAHLTIFTVEEPNEALVRNNLTTAALKIERQDGLYRFLYRTGPSEGFAFKEVISKNFNIDPRYIGIFAIQGFSENENAIPAAFDSFSFSTIDCKH
ncbi:MAG: hypothetical protein HOP08_19750 [Cyclobacteriaceae bacterium]|nr:hypothetical protein [Cyclobacteriaceae bacterium]